MPWTVLLVAGALVVGAAVGFLAGAVLATAGEQPRWPE